MQVREYEVDEEKQAQEESANVDLSNSAADKKRRLEQWSTTAYGEVIRSLQLLPPCVLGITAPLSMKVSDRQRSLAASAAVTCACHARSPLSLRRWLQLDMFAQPAR